jgi:hypothetical protein
MRLTSEDARIVSSLRRQGVKIPELIRAALRQEEQRKRRCALRRSTDDILDELFRAYPDDPSSPPPPVDATDRRALRAFIAARLKRETKTR